MTPVPFAFDQIDVLTTSGIDAWGQTQTVTTVSGAEARVEFANRLVLGNDGEQQVADFTAYVNPDVSAKAGDRVVFDSATYLLLEVRKQKDDVGVHHVELIGRTWRRE